MQEIILSTTIKINKNIKHGMNKHRLYPIWNAMKQRCSNQNHNRYYYYHSNGITVCDRWLEINKTL